MTTAMLLNYNAAYFKMRAQLEKNTTDFSLVLSRGENFDRAVGRVSLTNSFSKIVAGRFRIKMKQVGGAGTIGSTEAVQRQI